MDATYKQVQDKTINFIKTVELTPSAVVAFPCTAKIEYYDPRYHKQRVTQRKAKGEPRVVQFALPPIIVEDVSTSSVSTISEEDEPDYRPSRRHTESSIADLLDLFPLPPTYIPPTPPPPAAIRRVTKNVQNFSDIRVYSPAKPEDESVDSSETESTTASYSSGSDSNATADTSAPGSPLSSNDAVLSSNDSPKAPTFHDKLDISASTHVTRRSSEFTNETRPATSASVIMFVPVQTIELDHRFPKYCFPDVNPQDLIERSHNVVDDLNKADLQKGVIFDETHSKNAKVALIAQTGLQDLLKTSPSEDAIVDDLFAGLENSLEIDEECINSAPPPEVMEGLLETIVEVAEPDPYIQKPVAPLRIVKKTQIPAPPVAEVELDEDSTFAGISWEESLEKVLKMFKEAEAEDEDFHDLFYRQSSFFSQSSLVTNTPGLVDYSSVKVSPTETQDERSRRLDESFESVEKSVEDLLAELELLPDTVAINSEDGAIANTSLAITQETVEVVDVKSAAESIHSISSLINGDESVETSSSWTPTSQDSDEESKSSEDDDSQWSDLLGLDAYAD
ncbi:hypothetical protein BDN70DRAFT_189516 [Pholiota conissans]|uniref:Uncharacterized protein n=1 Tax=Pholiota conissans TaxID=109636 RepID=A0A9P6CX07_9AGAR|nr:hypothetical protein BDN70DRAFT_189516 [Pholiota conissans]